jgi:hypothetical protein
VELEEAPNLVDLPALALGQLHSREEQDRPHPGGLPLHEAKTERAGLLQGADQPRHAQEPEIRRPRRLPCEPLVAEPVQAAHGREQNGLGRPPRQDRREDLLRPQGVAIPRTYWSPVRGT